MDIKKISKYLMIGVVGTILVVFGIILNGCEKDQDEIFINQSDINYEIVVEIKGEVKNPNIYRLPQGSRISDLISVAGGFTSLADNKNVNLAALLEDGMIILINSNDSLIKKVNINQASYDELMTLKGMTKTRANNIIEYRNNHGYFNSIDELLKYKLVTNEIFDQIKEFITI